MKTRHKHRTGDPHLGLGVVTIKSLYLLLNKVLPRPVGACPGVGRAVVLVAVELRDNLNTLALDYLTGAGLGVVTITVAGGYDPLSVRGRVNHI